MDHVVIRRLEHLTGTAARPDVGYAVEMRDRPGPAHKKGAFPDDDVWIQLRGGLFVARARVEICWIGEYSEVREIRARTRGSPIHNVAGFWTGRPRYGYAAVARLRHETWTTPFWGGPRTYGYEWVLLDNDAKRAAWLERKPPPRSGGDILGLFETWKAGR